MNDLFLRKGSGRRLRGGHLWIYSNEVDSKRSPLSEFAAGDIVEVRSAGGIALGCAYMEPHSLICGRLYAPGAHCMPDEDFFSRRLSAALALREAAFENPFYRLVYGDSDGLPGVVIDRFGPYCVVQLNNAAIERYREALLSALCTLLKPEGVLLRGDSRSRREQGLDVEPEVAFGEVPTQVALQENGVHFHAPVVTGQKTGWFYDHRNSRARLRDWVSGKSVLDVYSYVGGWGVQAAAFGARQVCCVDSSQAALQGVTENAALNAVGERVSTQRGAAADVLEALQDEGRNYDVVILDPPAFIQRRRDLKKGIAAYRRINELGLRLLRPGGLLVSASCSMHLARQDLMSAIQGAAIRSESAVQIVDQGGQGPDHPIHPAIPETEYLKTLFARRH